MNQTPGFSHNYESAYLLPIRILIAVHCRNYGGGLPVLTFSATKKLSPPKDHGIFMFKRKLSLENRIKMHKLLIALFARA
jgi:hypothetical protein